MIKKFLFNSILFLLGIVLINTIYMLVIIKTDWNFKKRIESLNFKNPKYDVLVIGNSLAMDGIDTKLISDSGIEAYNMALGGSSLKTSFIQLNEYLFKYKKKPKYVILGIGTYISDLNSNQINPIVEVTMDNHKYNFKDLPLVKFKWLGIEFLKKIFSTNHRNATIVNGQLRFSKRVLDNTYYDNTNVLKIEKIQNSQWVKKIINLCSENNIKLYIVEMPGFKKVRHIKRFDYLKLFHNKHEAILLDFNTIEDCNIFDEKSDWIGNSHLNKYGAKKFTIKLIQKIHELEQYKNSKNSLKQL